MKFAATLLCLSVLSFPAFAIQCGDTITSTVSLTKNLDCSAHSGFAALILRDNAILRGNGYKIITPNTSVGVYAEGQLIKVKDVEIKGAPSAIGVMGYNVERLVVDNVKASDMNIGVDYYTEVDYDCDRLKVVDSDLSRNNYGAKVISPYCEYAPRFLRTNLSNSKQYALNLSARKLRITELQMNNFSNSANGLLLKATDLIVLEGLNLATAQIQGTQIFAYSTPVVKLRYLEVGNGAGAGIDLYDVGEAVIREVSSVGNGIGIKVANEQVATNLKIINSSTSNNNTAGVLVTSFGSVPFSSIDIDRGNSFSDLVSVQNQ